MTKYKASTPETEVSGRALLAYFQVFRYNMIQPLLVEYDLHNIDPKKWYPQQRVLDMYAALVDNHNNASENFVSVGMRLIENAEFPPTSNRATVTRVEDALQSLDAFYQISHRNTGGEKWTVTMTGSSAAKVRVDDPYPKDIAYGIIWGLMKRFLPVGTYFTVTPLNSAGLMTDADPVTYEVVWEV